MQWPSLLFTFTIPYSSHSQTFWSQDPFTILEITKDSVPKQESETIQQFK